MKKRAWTLAAVVCVLVICVGIVIAINPGNVIGPSAPTNGPTAGPVTNGEIIDIPDISGTPQSSGLPDPFDGVNPVEVVAEDFKLPEFINVKNFGAKGDGVTDDYDAVNKAIEKAGEEGSLLYFPAGTYYLSRKLVLNKSISILGENMNKVTLLFKDIPGDGPTEKYNQRGLITFTSDKLDVKGITVSYIADTKTEYTRQGTNSNGGVGLLFAILNGNNVSFYNCGFNVEEKNNPTVTCMWIKSEAYDIKNIKIEACKFINNSASLEGGGLWVSSHDSKNTEVADIEISRSYFFKRGNDEALGMWGYHISNVYIHGNSFVYSNQDVQNDIFIAFGAPSETRDECLKNVRFTNNTVELTGKIHRIIGLQVLTDDSDVEISDNIIMAKPQNVSQLNIFRLERPGNAVIKRNSIGVDGGNSVAYMVYTHGNVLFSENYFKTRNTGTTMLIRSAKSDYNPNVNVTFEKETFDFGASNTTSGTPIIQISPSGKLVFDHCEIKTASSAIHEIRLQMLYSKEKNFKYPANSLEFRNCNFDVTLMLSLKQASNTSVILRDSSIKNISFVTTDGVKCVEKLEVVNLKYDSFKNNYKRIQVEDMKKSTNELQTK